MDYAELVCRTNYSFLKATSSPEEIIIKSKDLGYHSIAITDEATVSGSVRAHICAKTIGINLIHGSQFWVEDIKSKMFFKFIFLPYRFPLLPRKRTQSSSKAISTYLP